jgi:hypothetical protein
MKEFFEEAKKYSQNIVLLILPVPTSLTAPPSSSVPPAMDPAPTEVA